MASENRIVVGCRVQAKVGPFIQDERSSFVSSDSCEEPSSKRRSFRRTRCVFHRTVVSSVPDKHWRVYWDCCYRTQEEKTRFFSNFPHPKINFCSTYVLYLRKQNSTLFSLRLFPSPSNQKSDGHSGN